MSSHKKLLFFTIISAIFHFLFLYYTKPNLLLFSSIQNIKLKKKDLTKVKLLKIKPKKPKVKQTTKPKTKIKKAKLKVKSKPKVKPKSKLKSKPKTKAKSKPKSKPKLKRKLKKSKIKSKSKSSKHKKTKTKLKTKKIDLSIVHKKVYELKKKEEEKRLKQELKKEAAIFYANRLVSLVQKLWIFPKSIPDSELPFLKIKIKLKVRKDGTIVGEPIIINKSKNKIFNESALRAVKKLYKYKIPLPEIIDDNYIDIILTLTPPEK